MAKNQANSRQIAIVGQGAIGGLIGFKCHQLGYAYQHLLRTPHQNSLKVTEINGKRHELKANNVGLTQATEFKTLIIPVKAYQVMDVLTQLLPLIQSRHTLVLLHNGMGTAELVKQRFPDNPLVVATTSYGAYKPSKDSLIETGIGHTHLGWLTEAERPLQSIIESDLSALLPLSTWHNDITLALWKKLVINAVINPLSAIHNIKNGQLSEAKYQAAIFDICAEISSVMNSLHYKTTVQSLVESVRQVITATANNYSSMHQDIASKRRTEIEFINGYIIKKGQDLNVATPHNQYLFEQIRRLESA